MLKINSVKDINPLPPRAAKTALYPFPPRPAKTTFFVILLCPTPDDFTRQRTASRWEIVKKPYVFGVKSSSGLKGILL